VRRRLLGATLALIILLPISAQAGVVKTWTHGPAAAEPVSSQGSSTIRTLTAHAGRLYAGYGDDTDNTGPIVLKGLNPATDPVSPSTTWADPGTSLLTEEIATLRSFALPGGNATLYAPFTDPRGGEPNGDYGVGARTPFAEKDLGNAAHLYDIAPRPNTDDLYACGQDLDDDGSVWRSFDGGVTWAQVRQIPNDAGDAMRVHTCGWIGDTFYGLVGHFCLCVKAELHRYIPTTNRWRRITNVADNPFYSSRSIGYGGDQYFLHKQPGTTEGLSMLFGYLSGSCGVRAEDINLDGSLFYRLDGATISSTTTPCNPASWAVKTNTAPTDAESVEVVGGVMYVGRSLGRISEVN
jgi:hypothetical protein